MRSPVYVCVWYDTEDYLTPAADDAALRLARLHTQYRLPATFKLVGEKARRLQQRGRHDVVAALRRHAIGYHTDLHSVHPVVTECCEELPWDEGVGMFRHAESAGCADVARIFERPIATFGQAGGAWAPQLYPVLREWGVPTYIDSGPWVKLDGAPFWYMGLLHVFGMGPNETRFRLREPGAELDAVAVYDQIVDRLAGTGGGVVSIYFHPTEWVTEAFWDAVNFARGANPARADWQCPPLPPPAEVERRFAAMEVYLRHLAESEAQPVTALDLAEMYRDRARRAYYSAAALVEATSEWTDTVGYAAVADGWLSAAEILSVVAALLRPDAASPPGSPLRMGQPQPLDGPLDEVPPLPGPTPVRGEALVAAADVVAAQCRPLEQLLPRAELPEAERPPRQRRRRVPSAVMVGGLVVRPEELLLGLIRALRTVVSTGELPDTVTLAPARLAPADHIGPSLGSFRWIIFPEGFEAPTVMAHAVRQAWTLKPAAPVPGWTLPALDE